jgi:hypothetical protein
MTSYPIPAPRTQYQRRGDAQHGRPTLPRRGRYAALGEGRGDGARCLKKRHLSTGCINREARRVGFVGDFSGRFGLQVAGAASSTRSAFSCGVWVVVRPRVRASNTRAGTETMPLGYCSPTARVLLVGPNPSGGRALRRPPNPGSSISGSCRDPALVTSLTALDGPSKAFRPQS